MGVNLFAMGEFSGSFARFFDDLFSDLNHLDGKFFSANEILFASIIKVKHSKVTDLRVQTKLGPILKPQEGLFFFRPVKTIRVLLCIRNGDAKSWGFDG